METSASLPLSIVIPVYNEAGNIGPTLEELEKQVRDSYEVIVVYDFEEDTTLPEVRAHQAMWPHVRLLKNTIARGPSGALRSGFREARGTRVLVLMADQCDDFSQIPTLLDLVPRRADIACPSRYCPGGRQLLEPGLKMWAPRIAGYLLRLLSGLDTYDPTNSFKMYSADVLRDLRLTSTISFSVTLEIVAKAHALGYRITELPTVWRDRSLGKTNFRLYRSLVAYFPWFLLAMAGSPFVPLRKSWRRRWFSADPVRT